MFRITKVSFNGSKKQNVQAMSFASSVIYQSLFVRIYNLLIILLTQMYYLDLVHVKSSEQE